DHVTLTGETPEGPYRLDANHVAACDGGRSAMRQLIGQESKGRVFRDRFLIADVKMDIDAPPGRWFWFHPRLPPNQSRLTHRHAALPTPKSDISRLFRDAVLELSKPQPFARTLVNSGRLSVPATLHGSTLNTPDAEAFAGRMVPGAAAADAPLLRSDGSPAWL